MAVDGSEVYEVTFTDDTIIYLTSDGGDGSFYSTIVTVEDVKNVSCYEYLDGSWLEDWEDILNI